MELFSAWIGYLVHHSAVKDNVVLSDFESIRRFHMSWRHEGEIITEEQAKILIASGHADVTAPWREIGYHKVTEQCKGRFTTRDGRPLWTRGAHEPKVNKNYLGHCFVGNFDKEKPSAALYDEGGREIAKTLNLCPNIMLDRIEPHHKYSPKSCPGFYFSMSELVDRVRFYAGRI